MSAVSKEICPCGSKKQYQYCCRMYHAGQKNPATAEQLMRSRYTAFYYGNIDYLMITLHPCKRTDSDRSKLAKTIKNTQWLNLTIINTSRGQKNDSIGYVEFEAVYQINQQPGQLHERSQFLKTEDKWFYVDGQFLPGLRPKPNELCWCGSAKKFKQCHATENNRSKLY